MLEEFVVEGANFVAVVPVNTELCDSPYMEAATITLENAFRPQRKAPEGFKLLTKRDVNPAVGSNLFIWKNGDIGNDQKMATVKFVDAARNAGLVDLLRFVESI